MKKVLLGTLLIPIAVTLVSLWPFIYNNYLFSLARLKNSIDIGDRYRAVESKFENYLSDYKGSDEIQFKIEKKLLFIYHVNMFDDYQLTVSFDDDGRVKNVAYIGD